MLQKNPYPDLRNFTCLRFKATLGSQSLSIVEFLVPLQIVCMNEGDGKASCDTCTRGEQWSECSSLETDSGFNATNISHPQSRTHETDAKRI